MPSCGAVNRELKRKAKAGTKRRGAAKKVELERRKLEREQLMIDVLRLERLGMSDQAIADKLGLWRERHVQELRKAAEERFRKIVRAEIEDHHVAMLEDIAVDEQEARRAWERSKRDRKRLTRKKAIGKDGNLADEDSYTREGRLPAAEYLRILHDCREQRAKILGAFKPQESRQIIETQREWVERNQRELAEKKKARLLALDVEGEDDAPAHVANPGTGRPRPTYLGPPRQEGEPATDAPVVARAPGGRQRNGVAARGRAQGDAPAVPSVPDGRVPGRRDRTK